ncbi:retrovirus-related pol polyprotein from transposon TNT 1-94 [Tanacetum coccineum]
MVRGKDTSLAHLKVFGCDSFVKVKDVCGEAMKCTFIGSGSDEMRYSFRDTKSYQVIQIRDITFVDSIYGASGSFKDSGRSDEEYSKDGASSKEEGSETPQWKKAIIEEIVSLEKNLTCSLVTISARKKALQRLWMFKVKEEHNGRKRYKARLVVKGFQQKRGVYYNEIFSPKYVKNSDNSSVSLEILGTKSLAEMFTRLVMKEKLKFCAASTDLRDALYRKSPSPAFGTLYRKSPCPALLRLEEHVLYVRIGYRNGFKASQNAMLRREGWLL